MEKLNIQKHRYFDINIKRCIEMFIKKIKSDDGLMGPTHALSAVAFALLFTWLANDIMFDKVLGSTDIVVFIAAMIVIVGASLMPDLDAVNSTSIITLGIVGVILSKGMRAFSSVIQNTIKGPYDKDTDPHRGFWHTFLSAFLVGLAFSGLANIEIELFKVGNNPIMISTFIVTFIIYISIQLALASLFKPSFNKAKKSPLGSISIKLGSLLISAFLVISLPPGLNYSWIGGAITFGWIAHLLGDMFTVSGVPILFPLKHKGKRWWNFRLPFGIKAGGYIEKVLLIPLFSIAIIISLFNIATIFN